MNFLLKALNGKKPKLIIFQKLILYYYIDVLDTDVSLLCVGIKLLNVQHNSINNTNDAKSYENQYNLTDFDKNKQLIIACATPICIFFIDLDSIKVINLIDFKANGLNLMPQLIEFHQIDNNYVSKAKFFFVFFFLNKNQGIHNF